MKDLYAVSDNTGNLEKSRFKKSKSHKTFLGLYHKSKPHECTKTVTVLRGLPTTIIHTGKCGVRDFKRQTQLEAGLAL